MGVYFMVEPGQGGIGSIGRQQMMASFETIVVLDATGPKGHRTGGFTLLELLVVMVIIGLLAAYVGPKYFGQIGKSEIKVARAQIDALAKALDQYRLDTGHYPTTDAGLPALTDRPSNEPRWAGPYLQKKVPLDPWGRPYMYKLPGEHGDFDLISYGKDGQPGGSGDSEDITNW
jgi:general secretion pathway protein G